MVQARPASTSYKVGKFVRRNKGLVASLCTIGALLIAAVCISGFFAIRANDAKNDALTEKKIADEKTIDAQQSAKRSKDALEIFTSSFLSVDPSNPDANATMTVKDVLETAFSQLKQSTLDDLGRANLVSALSNSFRGIGELKTAIDLAETEVALRIELHGESAEDTIEAKRNLITSYALGGDLKAAIANSEVLIALQTELTGDSGRETLAARAVLADLYFRNGDPVKAVVEFEQIVPAIETEIGERDRVTLNATNNLGIAYSVSPIRQD